MPLMLAGPLAKFLGILVLILAIFGAGEWHGRKAVQQAWDAAITTQAIAAGEAIIAQAENTARSERKYAKLKAESITRTRIVEKVVREYVNFPDSNCQLSPRFERDFNTVSRMLDADSNGVSSTDSPTGGAPGAPETPLGTSEILLSHQEAVRQLRDLWDTYEALAQWVKSNYELSRAGSGRPVTITE